RGGGNALPAGDTGQGRDGKIERRISEAEGGVDSQYARSRRRGRGACVTVNLADFRLRGIARDATETMPLEAVRLGGDEGARDRARIGRARSATLERRGDQCLGFGEGKNLFEHVGTV